MYLLTQFIFRLSFGLAVGMALTNPKQVTSGYYRNHLYVLMGLNVLATLVAWSAPEQFVLWPALTAALLSYLGSAVWLYEKPKAGIAILVLVAAVTLLGAYRFTDWHLADGPLATALVVLDPPTGGLVLGLTIAAMFLGHWYLNTPTMVIAPLKKLVLLMGAAIVLRAIVEGLGLAIDVSTVPPKTSFLLTLLAMRWLAGILGALILTVMAWKTLEIPNTQSATGILYVAVIVTFLGELTSLILWSQSSYSM